MAEDCSTINTRSSTRQLVSHSPSPPSCVQGRACVPHLINTTSTPLDGGVPIPSNRCSAFFPGVIFVGVIFYPSSARFRLIRRSHCGGLFFHQLDCGIGGLGLEIQYLREGLTQMADNYYTLFLRYTPLSIRNSSRKFYYFRNMQQLISTFPISYKSPMSHLKCAI